MPVYMCVYKPYCAYILYEIYAKAVAYRGGGLGLQTPRPPEIPEFWQSRTGLQIERKMFSVPIPTSKLV
jgi:hypothetical protein